MGQVSAVTAGLLLAWLVQQGAFDDFIASLCGDGLSRDAAERVLLEEVEDELAVADAHFRSLDCSGPVELEGDFVDEAEDAERHLETTVHGWPGRQGDPAGMRAPGRFEKRLPPPRRWAGFVGHRPAPAQ